MVLGLRCCSPARRPHSASLSVRVPTLAHLLAASFSLALTGSALQFSYRYHHRSGRGPFIPIVLAHAGHTSAGILPASFFVSFCKSFPQTQINKVVSSTLSLILLPRSLPVFFFFLSIAVCFRPD